MRYLVLLLGFTVIAGQITYQGKLTDGGGRGINADLDMVFRIYEEAGDTPLWEETHTAVPVEKGLFNIDLGSITPLDLPFDEPYFLEIEIDRDIMAPRLPIHHSAFAFRAEIADSVAGGSTDGDWTISGDDLILAVTRNIVAGGADPDTMNRLEVTARALTGARAISGIHPTGGEGWLGTELYGAYGQFDSYNYGYVGGSGIGSYGRGDTWAGYFEGDVNVTGQMDIAGNLNLSALSNITISGDSGDDGQVLSRSGTTIAWSDVEDIASLWVDNGLAMAPADSIGSNIRVAQREHYTYGFYATMNAGEDETYAGYFVNSATTGSATGVVGSATSSESNEMSMTVGGRFAALSASQASYATFNVAAVLDTASENIARGHLSSVEQHGYGQMAGHEYQCYGLQPNNTEMTTGLNVSTLIAGRGNLTGGLFTTEAVNPQYDGIFSGIENYGQSVGKGETYGIYTQIVADNDSANLAQSYGISSAASYNGKSFLWGIYSWTEMSDTGEVAAFYGQSLKPSDIGLNYGGYIYAADGEQVRGWYAHAVGASGSALTGNIGMFAYGGTSPAIDIGIYARTDLGFEDYAGYFNGTVLSTGYEVADLAEMYPDDGDIPDGALVSISFPSADPEEVRVGLSQIPYDINLVGVRSDKPAILMGRAENYNDYAEEERALWQEKEAIFQTPPSPPERPVRNGKDDPTFDARLKEYEIARKAYEKRQRDRQARLSAIETRLSEIIGLTDPRGNGGGSPVALAGRISVLVTDENGSIKAGDPITSSSTPGYGMKATEAGPIVGYALGDFEEGKGKVAVNISRSWYASKTTAMDRGMASFEGRQGFVPFSKNFAAGLTQPPIVTITPKGSFTSLSVTETTLEGFYVESATGDRADFNWMAVK